MPPPADALAATDHLLSRDFVLVTATAFLVLGSFFATFPLIPGFVEDELGGGPVAVGLAVGIFAVSAVAVRPLIVRIGQPVEQLTEHDGDLPADPVGAEAVVGAGAAETDAAFGAAGCVSTVAVFIAMLLGPHRPPESDRSSRQLSLRQPFRTLPRSRRAWCCWRAP